MKYLCLVYLEPAKWHAVPDHECASCGDGLRARGVLVAAGPLRPVETATTVRVRNGRVYVTTNAATWNNRSTGLPSGEISDIMIAPDTPSTALLTLRRALLHGLGVDTEEDA